MKMVLQFTDKQNRAGKYSRSETLQMMALFRKGVVAEQLWLRSMSVTGAEQVSIPGRVKHLIETKKDKTETTAKKSGRSRRKSK